MKKITKSGAGKTAPATPEKPAKKASTKAPFEKPASPSGKKGGKPSPAKHLTNSTQPPIVRGIGSVSFSTKIVALVDVGFGNSLYIRGEGPGLNWEKGILLECVADDRWAISLPESSQPVVFKVLLNDLTWCAGDDYVIQPGAEAIVTPTF